MGAVLGGAIFSFLGYPVIYHFSLWSMLVAIIGAIVVLLVWHAATGSRGLK